MLQEFLKDQMAYHNLMIAKTANPHHRKLLKAKIHIELYVWNKIILLIGSNNQIKEILFFFMIKQKTNKQTITKTQIQSQTLLVVPIGHK